MDKVFPSEVAHARGHVPAETEAELRQVMLCSGVRPRGMGGRCTEINGKNK